MASCAGVFQFLTSLLFLKLVVQQCPLVKGDKALINSVCSKTGNYKKYCLDCFNTRGSEEQDIKGLAKFSILCASSTSFDTRQATLDLAKNATGQFQKNLYKCVGILVDTLDECANAVQNVRVGHYSDATKHLNLAKNKVLDCLNVLGIQVLSADRLPDYLLNDFATLKGIANVAINVVSQVPSY